MELNVLQSSVRPSRYQIEPQYSAYHPQTNGLVERTNEVVETALRHYVAPDQTDWNKRLPFVEFALNDMKRDASGVTPFRMNRVTVPLSPFEGSKGQNCHSEGYINILSQN